MYDFVAKEYMFMRQIIYVFTFLLFFLVGCVSSGNSKTNDIYLIPEGYEGYVYAFYNVKGAPEVKKEGDYEAHTINDKGYFVTSTPNMDYGTVTDKYYYVDKSGKRTKINSNCIRGMGTGGTERYEGADSKKKLEIHYTGIEIRKKECSKEFTVSSNGMDSADTERVLKEILLQYYNIRE
ncbi:DUF6843 domain-containing protein [Ectobacillus panaciterrae]|uniref:DUF6843 domain-containing protein n=1 Tax=Ectobacillus panaciterrae TaxID=363872 RepID=UPI00040078F1|nr:hypothetical protein [Ectobacillus panaciterrae]